MNSTNQSKCIKLVIPQLGEGLREVKIVRLLKQPGDWIKEEEILYEMETDKSVVEVESAHQGKIKEWLVEEGCIISVGETLGYLQEIPTDQKSTIPGQDNVPLKEIKDKKLRAIPPRTRAYCKKHGITVSEMLDIPSTHRKLMPADVDRYLQSKNSGELENVDYCESLLSSQQQLLIQRFKQSQVVPASLVSVISVDALNKGARALINTNNIDKERVFVSEFQVVAYAVAQICVQFPKFRSILMNGGKLRVNNHINLGIAVQTHNEDLVTAVIPNADKLCFSEFIEKMQQQIMLAYQGIDQVKQHPSLILSYMGQSGIMFGGPLLVEPAVAILFFGASYRSEEKLLANLSLTFDHRIINGMLAAKFLQEIASYINALHEPTPIENVCDQNLEHFQQWFLTKLSSLLGKDQQQIDLSDSLGVQGLDSFKAIQLTKYLEDYFKESFSPTLLWHYPSYKLLVTYLKERFSSHNFNSSSEMSSEFNTLLKELQNLSTSELDQLFEEVK